MDPFLSQKPRRSVSLVSTGRQCPTNRLAHGDDVHPPKLSLHGLQDGSRATLHPLNMRESYKALAHSPLNSMQEARPTTLDSRAQDHGAAIPPPLGHAGNEYHFPTPHSSCPDRQP